MQEYANFAGRMINIGEMRVKQTTLSQLRKIFDSYTLIGGKTKVKAMIHIKNFSLLMLTHSGKT